VETLLDLEEVNGTLIAQFNELNLDLFIKRLSFLNRIFEEQGGM
jgi:hypothetical protein